MRFLTNFKLPSLLLLLLLANIGLAQESGDDDLEAAFDLKIKAEKVGDFEDVVKLCKSALKKGLDEEGEKEAKTLAASALFEQAEQLMLRIRRQRDPTFYRNQAVKLLKEAVDFDPNMGEGWLLIAKMNILRGGDADEARSSIDEAIKQLDKLPEKKSEAYLLRSMMIQKDDREGAREDLDKAIELNDSNVGALRARSTLQIIEGDVQAGLDDVEKMLDINEGKENFLVNQAGVLARMADAKAISAARAKMAAESGDDEPADEDAPEQSIEELESDTKLIRESILKIFDRLTKVAPKNDAYQLGRVNALWDLKKKEEALKAIDELIEKDDRSILALRQKAEFLLPDNENDEETLKLLDRAIKLDPYDADTRRLRLRYFSAKEQFGEAIVEAEKILEKEPTNAGMMDRLALLYSVNDEPEKAIEIYDSLLVRMPMSFLDQLPPRSRPIFLAQKISTLRSRGDAHLSTGEHEDAIEDYEEALDLGDQIEEMQASLGTDSDEYKPDDGVLNNLAWVLATSTDDDLRDGKRAIELATLACEVTEYKMPHIISTLASGYAEEGKFDEAIKWIEKGLEVNEDREITERVTEAEIKRQRESLEKELESYRNEIPWRENQAEEAKEKEEAEKKEAEAKEAEASDDGDDSDEEKEEKSSDDSDDSKESEKEDENAEDEDV